MISNLIVLPHIFSTSNDDKKDESSNKEEEFIEVPAPMPKKNQTPWCGTRPSMLLDHVVILTFLNLLSFLSVFNCKYCNKVYKSRQSLHNHVSKAASKSACSKIHVRNTPSDTNTKRNLKCEFPDCNGSFSTVNSRRTHYHNIHKKLFNPKYKNTGEAPYHCKTCNRRFSRGDSLKRHEIIHTREEPFECKSCDKRFKQSSALKYHEKHHK